MRVLPRPLARYTEEQLTEALRRASIMLAAHQITHADPNCAVERAFNLNIARISYEQRLRASGQEEGQHHVTVTLTLEELEILTHAAMVGHATVHAHVDPDMLDQAARCTMQLIERADVFKLSQFINELLTRLNTLEITATEAALSILEVKRG